MSDKVPLRLCPRLVSSLLAVLTWSSLFGTSVTAFVQTGSSLELTAQNASISVSQLCDDEFECRSQLASSSACLNDGVCTESETCNGRTDFPVLHRPLRSWQLPDLTSACVVETGVPDNFPTLGFEQDLQRLHVNGSAVGVAKACNARGNRSDYDDFTLTFWLHADCQNCSVLELSQQSKDPIHLRVVDGMFCALDQCLSNVLKPKWTFVAIKVYKKTVTAYAAGQKLKLSSPLLQDVNIENIFIGSSEVASPDNEFDLYDVRYYSDVLTKREMDEIKQGLPDTSDGPCRCPPSHPILSATNPETECQDESGDVYPRFNSSVHFNPPSVLLDPSTDKKWATAEKGNVSLVFTFGQSYEVESVQIEFASVMPAFSSITLKLADVENTEELLQCTGSTCEISYTHNSPSATVSTYTAKLADEIRIVLARDSPSDVQSYIVNKVTISGRCDCHGNADACNVTDGSYVCQCKADTNSAGPNCKSCAPNFFRETSDFDCPHSCLCSMSGVADADDQCDELGGNCKCKERVTGTTCGVCKPWTYGLDSDKEKGCSLCTCTQTGTAHCDNVTGECVCKANTQAPGCDTCTVNHYGLNSPEGCQSCSCETAGTESQKLACDSQTGQCECKNHVEGLKCDQCKSGFFSLDVANTQGCILCDCHTVGIEQNVCDTVTGQCPCRNGVITDKKCTPEIISVDPHFGPAIGGTKITIQGRLLGNASVFFGTEPQKIISMDDSVIMVESSAHAVTQGDGLVVKLSWQGEGVSVSKPLVSGSFSFLSNPVLDASKALDVHSYLRGGCIVNVYGTNLKNVKYPKLDVINVAKPNVVAIGTCREMRDYFTCFTPDVTHLYTSAQDQFRMTVVFDGVTSSSMGRIFIQEDPVVHDTGNIRFQYPFEKTISIYGKNLQSACQLNGVEVLTGVINCTIVSISNSHIECEPTGISPGGDNKRVIKVTVGSMSTVVGTLEYLEFYETDGFIIICCSILAVILIIIVVIIVLRYRRYRKQRSKASSKLTDTRDASNRQMNTYSEITQLANGTNGHSGMVVMENVVPEHKKGIVNSEVEISVFTEEFLPFIEPGNSDAVKESFVGESSFTFGSCRKTGQRAKLFDGTLKRNGVEIQKLSIRSLLKPISEVLKTSSESNSGPTLVPWANLALSECLRLRRFKHNHILNSLGIGYSFQRFHLLYAYPKNGSLKDLVADTSKEFSVRQLLGFGQQVAEGVSFLASKDVTHKDVAARNCMVDDYSIVKIGDASFSWDFYPKEYVYNEQRERFLPLRWMAPESLTDGYYDMRTDVWSFGVLVWELLTRGCLPFHEVNDDQVKDYVLNGYILGKPETISDNVYDLLRNCWSPENENRPSMATLSRSLSYMLESESDDDTYSNGHIVTAQLTQGVSTPRRAANRNAQFYCSTDLSHV